MILFTGMSMYFVISYNGNMLDTIISYFIWVINFFQGNFGFTADSMEITFFNFSNDSSKLAIGSKYLNTILLSFLSIIVCFFIALILNLLTIVYKNNIALIIKNIIEWLSSLHIIIICLFILALYQDSSIIMAIVMVCLGTNAFFEISSSQFNAIKELNSKDFIIAARAWGDNPIKHMKRTFLIDSINQVMGSWMLFFSNVMIYEIIFQKSGLGYLLFKHFILVTKTIYSESNTDFVSEPNLFLAISMLVIITICFLNTLKKIIITYLMDYKR